MSPGPPLPIPKPIPRLGRKRLFGGMDETDAKLLRGLVKTNDLTLILDELAQIANEYKRHPDTSKTRFHEWGLREILLNSTTATCAQSPFTT